MSAFGVGLRLGLGLGLVGLLMTGAPDAGVKEAPAWSVTWTSSTESDPGNGTIIGSEQRTATITPSEERLLIENESRDAPPHREESKHALDPRRRAAIEALLPKLPKASAVYSLSKYVNDEGGHGEELSVVFGGKTLHFQLRQGPGPKAPDEIRQLYKLVVGNEMPPE
jgi:hypothetical protein